MFALGDLNLAYLVSTTAVSLYASTATVALNVALGLPILLAVGFRDFCGKPAVISVVSTRMGFPSVVVRPAALLVLSRSGPLRIFELLFTPGAMILLQTILALLALVSVSLSAAQSAPQDLRGAVSATGGISTDIALLTVREMRYGIVTVLLVVCGYATSEVGSALVIGGDIVSSDNTSSTRTPTMAIAVGVRKGSTETGIALGTILFALALGVDALDVRFRDRTPERNRRGQ